MNIEERVHCTLDGEEYRDLNNLMQQAFLAGKNESKEKNNNEYAGAIKALHCEVKEMIQTCFDAGRNYEKSRT